MNRELIMLISHLFNVVLYMFKHFFRLITLLYCRKDSVVAALAVVLVDHWGAGPRVSLLGVVVSLMWVLVL